jgi:hypothetical protein
MLPIVYDRQMAGMSRCLCQLVARSSVSAQSSSDAACKVPHSDQGPSALEAAVARRAEMAGFCCNVFDRLLKSSRSSRHIRRSINAISTRPQERQEATGHSAAVACAPSHPSGTISLVRDAQISKLSPRTPRLQRAYKCCRSLAAECGEQPNFGASGLPESLGTSAA